MKLRKFLYGLTLMLGCFVFAACVNDEDGQCLSDGKTQTQVLFSLSLKENTKALTRAGNETWNDYDPKDTGVEYDNYIDLDNVQMLLFEASSGDYAGTLGIMTYSKTGENKYEYIGTAPADISVGDYKFVVLANCADAGLTVGTSKIADLDTKTYNLFADSGNSEFIPMWGVLKASLTLVAGSRQEIGTIHLLRAVSKVTVKLEAQEGATGNPLRGYSLEKVALSNFNKIGYVTPTGAATAETTTELNLDASLHAYASAGTDKEFAVASAGDTELTIYLPEYENSTTAPAVLTVYLTKTVGEGESATTINFDAPIQFCDYFTSGDNKGKPDTSKPYNIIRNHNYQFQIYSVSDDGALYVKPTVADWIDTEELTYPIDMSTSMRLFDSWLYRYDTDGQYGWSDGGYDHWNESHLVVSSGRGTATEAEPAGRPLHSPQIQLVTTASAGSFELYIDNDQFEIVQANKNETGVVTSYTTSSDGTLTIAAGEDVYTYFYIVPKEEVTPSNPVAKVFLYYNDTALGKLEMPFNYSSLPGYSDDSSEIWAYYVSEDAYEAGQIDDDNKFMRMYYQDVKNPLVPVE